ncbi:MAG: hypothetical protein JKY54_12240 [Flavobacteriales bacterium]|nr:hypothetical protein [Flavobacteriales bacterium]
MPSTATNKLKDLLGIIKAVCYRTFVKWNWSKPQPMFNIVEVKEGTEQVFEDFLKQSLVISLTYNTPISIGPYKSAKTRTYIYVTQYCSTGAFMKVVTKLLTTGVSSLRSKAIEQTSWTYCSRTISNELSAQKNILMIGIQGDPAHFLGFLNQHGIQTLATIKKIKDVRGRSLGNHLMISDTTENNELLTDFVAQGGDINIYKAAKL